METGSDICITASSLGAVERSSSSAPDTALVRFSRSTPQRINSPANTFRMTLKSSNHRIRDSLVISGKPGTKHVNKTAPNIISHEKAEEGQEGRQKRSAKKHQTGKAGKSLDRKTARQQLVVAKRAEKYRGRRADFLPFAASVFSPHIFTGRERALTGCGATALALITGVPPEKIAAKHRGRHYSDRFMVRFLRRRGFRLLRLTPLQISTARTKVGSEHVILISQLLRDYDATWGVIFDDIFYHNFTAYNLSALGSLNKPILSAYLVIHPSWRVPEDFELPRPVRRLAGPKFNVSDLRKGAEFSGLRNWA